MWQATSPEKLSVDQCDKNKMAENIFEKNIFDL